MPRNNGSFFKLHKITLTRDKETGTCVEYWKLIVDKHKIYSAENMTIFFYLPQSSLQPLEYLPWFKTRIRSGA